MNRRKTNKLRFLIALVIIGIIILAIFDQGKMVLRFIYPVKYTSIVSTYSKANNLEPFVVLAVINAESGFDSNAISSKNAIGLMQIRENTGLWVANQINIDRFSKNELYNPETNIKIGCWYLSLLIKEFRNNSDLALAAYNAGSGNVNKWLKNGKLNYNHVYINKIPFKETREYVKKVKKLQSIYRKLYENIF